MSKNFSSAAVWEDMVNMLSDAIEVLGVCVYRGEVWSEDGCVDKSIQEMEAQC